MNSGLAVQTASSVVLDAMHPVAVYGLIKFNLWVCLLPTASLNSHLTGDSIQVVIGDSCEGSVRFVNCGFWGPVNTMPSLTAIPFLSRTAIFPTIITIQHYTQLKHAAAGCRKQLHF